MLVVVLFLLSHLASSQNTSCALSVPGQCTALEESFLTRVSLCGNEDECRALIEAFFRDLQATDSELEYSSLMSPTLDATSLESLISNYSVSTSGFPSKMLRWQQFVAVNRLTRARDAASRVRGNLDAMLTNLTTSPTISPACVGLDWIPNIAPYSFGSVECNTTSMFNSSRSVDALQTRVWQNLRLNMQFAAKARGRCSNDDCREWVDTLLIAQQMQLDSVTPFVARASAARRNCSSDPSARAWQVCPREALAGKHI
jgi:hypothetical protein